MSAKQMNKFGEEKDMPARQSVTKNRTKGTAKSRFRIKRAPKLTVSNRVKKTKQYDPDHEYKFRYRAKRHTKMPHIVKFSGGRSSGMLLCALLQNKILDARRGDVVIFNNTAAEHPETYEFANKCKYLTEIQYGIPFFWVEYQTYEDARNGEWTRLPSYRLTNSTPWSPENPDGYHYKGEPFEEMLSLSGYVPNQFRRTCTYTLKLESTRMFLRDWLACKKALPRLGHWQDTAQVDEDALYRQHIQNNGRVPRGIYLRKKQFVLTRPTYRPEQRYQDFTRAPIAIENPILNGKAYGENADFGPGGVEYVAFLGLRDDEPLRVERVRSRASNGRESQGYEGEHIYMPLADMHISNEDVRQFWDNQDWNLALPPSGHLSNCVYCFLKGTGNLAKVYDDPRTLPKGHEETPADIRWWTRIEQEYGRDMKAEDRNAKDGIEFFGFFGANRLTYRDIAEKGSEAFTEDNAFLPCDCTD